MLPARLVEITHTGAGELHPRWLLPSDDPWLRELAHEASALAGSTVDDADQRVVERVASAARRHGASRRVVAAAWAIERRRWALAPLGPVAPRELRRVLFRLAAERPRDEALATAAALLSLEVGDIDALLFADRAGSRRLCIPASPPTATEMRDAYNLALMQSLIGRATEVSAVARTHLRSVVRYAKLLGLMMTVAESPGGSTILNVSGAMALFHDTTKYGHALARWIPALIATAGWSLRARLVFGSEAANLVLDASAPIPRTHALPRAHDSRWEATLDRDLRRNGGDWQLEREVAVIRVPTARAEATRLMFPDFALTCPRGRVLVELVGYWTPEYLAEKRALLDAVRVPFVLCLNERYADATFAADPRVVLFKKRVEVAALLAACDRALSHATRTR